MTSGESAPVHSLVPKHEILAKDEEEKLLAYYKTEKQFLPKIYKSDPALRSLNAQEGDIIKIEREDSTGKNVYYRLVIR